VEYLSSALVDMALHNRAEPVTDVDAFERETLAAIGMPREIAMRHRLPHFGHLLSSDSYSAGYYSGDGRRHLGNVRGQRQRAIS
jgi:peptidyl-dipeptidase Dcp